MKTRSVILLVFTVGIMMQGCKKNTQVAVQKSFITCNINGDPTWCDSIVNVDKDANGNMVLLTGRQTDSGKFIFNFPAYLGPGTYTIGQTYAGVTCNFSYILNGNSLLPYHATQGSITITKYTDDLFYGNFNFIADRPNPLFNDVIGITDGELSIWHNY